MSLSDEALLDEIRRLAAELGHPPTLQDFREQGDYAAMTYYNRFGSWRAAVEAAGFESQTPQEALTKDDLIAELRALADDLGDAPTVSQMNDQGAYWGSTYRKHFGSWNDALEAAGLTGREPGGRIPTDDLLEELQRLADELGEPPSRGQLREHGAYDSDPYRRRFGSWSAALEAAGFEPAPAPASTKLTADQLQQELARLADDLGKQPTMREMSEHGQHSPNTYVRHFGSWSAAIEATFDK